MPLARFALYESGVEIYVASTADDGERWQSTLVHIALESRAFVIAPCHFQRAASYPDDFPLRAELEGHDVIGRGGSADPGARRLLPRGAAVRRGGRALRGARSGCPRAERQRFDPAGHYHRPDVLRLDGPSAPLAHFRH